MSTSVIQGRLLWDASPQNIERLRTMEIMRFLRICILITVPINLSLELKGCNINNS